MQPAESVHRIIEKASPVLLRQFLGTVQVILIRRVCQPCPGKRLQPFCVMKPVVLHVSSVERYLDIDQGVVPPTIKNKPRHKAGFVDTAKDCATAYFQPVACFKPLPMSARLRTVVTPASCSAANFSAAVPLPPAMMAPAWPMRLPGGAVTPAM